jgi:predicted nucleotidyltransferase/HEPN domain-containing protein
MSRADADPRAVAVAQAVHQRERPQATILFGSRARGDYHDKYSDIDLLLVCDGYPDTDAQIDAMDFAHHAVKSIYQREVPFQLQYVRRHSFDAARPYINSVSTQALLTGVIMTDNPEEFTSQYANQPQGFPRRYNWPEYDNHVAAARDYLDAFNVISENNPIDRAAGQMAQQALERAMKAAIIAHGATPERNTHDLGGLLGTLRRIDPGLSNYHFSVDPIIYNQYAGGERYEMASEQPHLTEVENYYEDTAQDVHFLLAYARQVEERNRPNT